MNRTVLHEIGGRQCYDRDCGGRYFRGWHGVPERHASASDRISPRRSRFVRLVAVMAVLSGVFAFSSTARAADPRLGALRFSPELPLTGDNLKVTMKFLGGAIRAEVTWFLNENEVQESNVDSFEPSAELNHPIEAGDKITVEVTAFDSVGKSGGPFSRSVVCQNAPPQIRLVRQDLSGETYVATIEAEDPEGRAVSFTLKQGPRGMKLDDGGNIRWDMPKDTSGSFTVKVAAQDEDGGEAVISFTFTIRR